MLKILALLGIFLFGSMTYDGAAEYFRAGTPLVAKEKMEALWKLERVKEKWNSYPKYYLSNGKLKLKICGDTNGYIECSRFMSKQVQGLCPAQATTGAASTSSTTKVQCKQSLGRRLEAEPLVVAYNGQELVSVSKPNGEPVLSASEWADARKGYLQRLAVWKFVTSAIFTLLLLGS